MKITHLLPLLMAAALLSSTAAVRADSRWNSAPYAATPPLVTETADAFKKRVTDISTFPTVLDPRLWKDDKLRPEVRQRVLDIAAQLFADLKLEKVTIDPVKDVGHYAITDDI